MAQHVCRTVLIASMAIQAQIFVQVVMELVLSVLELETPHVLNVQHHIILKSEQPFAIHLVQLANSLMLHSNSVFFVMLLVKLVPPQQPTASHVRK